LNPLEKVFCAALSFLVTLFAHGQAST